MYRVVLNGEARQELVRRSRSLEVSWRTRDRLEMVRLSDAGWSIPRIAQHLGISEHRVRYWIKAYLQAALMPSRISRI
jgi:predicted transcriptional regulator